MRVLMVLLLMLALAGCTSEATQKTSDRINGRWHSGKTHITIDLNAGTLTGVFDGDPVMYRIRVMREQGRTVVLQVDDTTMFASIRNNGTLVLTRETGGPRVLERVLW
jgi:hypothetical protein